MLCLSTRHELTEGNRLLSAAKAQAETISETIPLGITTPAGDEKANLMGFDRLVNQRLLPPTFPRYTATRSRESAVAHFRALADRLVAATSVALRANNFHNAVEFFVDYSANSPCVLSRSVLQERLGRFNVIRCHKCAEYSPFDSLYHYFKGLKNLDLNLHLAS